MQIPCLFNWPTFWAAVEALATTGALIVALVILFRELPKFRKEMAARKVEGLKFAGEQLESRQFIDSSKFIVDAWRTGGDEIPAGVDAHIPIALSSLDFVAKLINQDYIDKDLFLYTFAERLQVIERALTNFGTRADWFVPAIKASYPDGFALLEEASRYISEEREKEAERFEA